ncbi:hypothetical protein L7F22_046521 [Adiantum nelumboides]|nr:hypothetical protein [Adiantum nelumboides]
MGRGGLAALLQQASPLVLLIMIMLARESRAAPTSSCLSSFAALSTPCDPYFQVLDAPSAECCGPIGDLITSDATCICEVLDAAEAKGVTLNKTRLVEMFVQCELTDVPSTATYCLPSLPTSTPSTMSPPPLEEPTSSPPPEEPTSSRPPLEAPTSSPPPLVEEPTSSPPPEEPTSSPPPPKEPTSSPPPPEEEPTSSPPSPPSVPTDSDSSPPPPPTRPSTRVTKSAPPPPPPPATQSTSPSSLSKLLGSNATRLPQNGSLFLLNASFIFLSLLGFCLM